MSKQSPEKQQAIENNRKYISSEKVAFFEKYGMDFVMGRREGPYLYDIDGEKRLFNLHCNGGVFNHGHLNQQFKSKLESTISELDIGNHHLLSRYRGELAALLADLMPGDLNYTVFGVSGGESVDLALKVARAFTDRQEIISVRGGYHGHTGLALAAGDPKYREPFGKQLPGFRQIPFMDLRLAENAITDETAAVLLETVPATLGMPVPSADYMQGMRKICDDTGTLLILDEVQTGLGRTGKLWGFEHYDILPDMAVLGKGLSGGLYPITATVMREPLEQVFHPDPFIHISTFGGAEIGCRVAIEVLKKSSDSAFLEHVNRLADHFRLEVQHLQEKHPSILRGLRQLGLMMALELQDEYAGPVLTKAAYDQDLLMIYANNDTSCVQFLPPLNLTIEEADIALDLLDGALKRAGRLHKIYRAKAGIQNLWEKVTGKL